MEALSKPAEIRKTSNLETRLRKRSRTKEYRASVPEFDSTSLRINFEAMQQKVPLTRFVKIKITVIPCPVSQG